MPPPQSSSFWSLLKWLNIIFIASFFDLIISSLSLSLSFSLELLDNTKKKKRFLVVNGFHFRWKRIVCWSIFEKKQEKQQNQFPSISQQFPLQFGSLWYVSIIDIFFHNVEIEWLSVWNETKIDFLWMMMMMIYSDQCRNSFFGKEKK